MTAKTQETAATGNGKTEAKASSRTAKAAAGNGQAAVMVNMNEMSIDMFAKACQAYMTSWATMNGEVANFLSKRFSHDAELSARMASCGSLTEVANLQRDWAQEAAEEYMAEANKLMELASKVASENWQPVIEQVGEAAGKAVKRNS